MAAAVALAVLSLSPAFASFHLVKVVEVFGGTAASPNAQYVVLQMYAGDQTEVQGQNVTVFDAAGSQIMAFPFPTSVANGADQARILIATSEAQTFFSVTPDLTMTAVIPAAGGKVCFGTIAFPIDCVAWGSYDRPGGDASVGTPFNSPASPQVVVPDFGLVSGKALARRLDLAGDPVLLDPGDDTNNSATDLLLRAPLPINNAYFAGFPPPSTCGNTSIEGLEGCDDGGTVSGDGCSGGCVDEFCGDGFINDIVETCDDGNRVSGDGCSATCTDEDLIFGDGFELE